MATDDQQVLVTGQASAPATFKIPGNGQIRPKAIFASFDGTGAAGAFLPALKVVSDAGELVGIFPTDTTVAAGASADVSWFPRLGGAAAATASGGVVGAYKNRTNTDTFGPVSNHVMLFSAGTLVTNDPSTFTSPDNFTIGLTHGGLVMAGLVGEFGTNGGVAYAGQFEMQTQILDSANVLVDQLMGPDVYASELYSTDPGDDFQPNGYSIWNCDDSSFTPPYKLTASITVNKNVTFISYAMFAAILSPTGLT